MSRRSAARARKPLDAAVLAALGLGGLAVLGAALLLLSYDGFGFVSLAPVEEGRAAELLDSRALSAAGRARAERAARSALARSPTRAVGWLELAYARSLGPQGFGPVSVQALQRSYDFEPLGPDVSEWRLDFVFEHWDRVTPDIRAAALAELEALWQRQPRRKSLSDMVERITNPAGRVAAALTLRRLRRGG